MKILHVSCSPHGQASESHRLARRIIDFLQRAEPTAVLVDRVLGSGTLPPVDDDYAAALGAAQASSAESICLGSIARSDVLIQELESADVLVIGVPMHNFTVPSTLKAWIDHIVRIRRTFDAGREGKVGKLRDRPVFVAVSSGSIFSGDRSRQPDFLTPYLKAILAVVGLHDVTFFSVEGTAFGVDALDGARARTDLALDRHFGRVRRR